MMVEKFDDLTLDEIKFIAREKFVDGHKLIITKGINYIVSDIDDFLCYGDVSNSIINIESSKDLKKFFIDNDGYNLDEETKEDLILESEKIDCPFFLAIKDNGNNGDNPYDFSIQNSFDKALSFIDNKSLSFIDDEDKIINEHAETYLKAGFMQNNFKYNERTVLNNYFDLDEILEMKNTSGN